MKTNLALGAIMLLAIMMIAAVPIHADEEYKSYSRQSRYDTLMTIAFDKTDVTATLEMDGTRYSATSRKADVVLAAGVVKFGEEIWFDSIGVNVAGASKPYSLFHETYVKATDSITTLSILTRRSTSERVARLKRGNRIKFSGDAIVDEEEFVRGVIFRVQGDVEIYGEVNKDVVTLFGDIYIGPEAVVRGNAVTLTGRIDVASDAAVYGETISPTSKRRSYKNRFRGSFEQFSMTMDLRYNRVDGLAVWWGQRFQHEDPYIPSFWGKVGYGFASERWRFDVGVEQTIWDQAGLSLGGEYYRKLDNDDAWIIGQEENSFHAILTRRDYSDYWEAEGTDLWLKFQPTLDLEVRANYKYEDTKWLKAHHNLWSLFAAEDKFFDNYNVVDSAPRSQGIMAIDSNTYAALGLSLSYDTRNDRRLFERSGWYFTGDLEWSHPDLDSDYDFTRYRLGLRRYQRIDRHKMVLLRAVYGNSDGVLPMHKRFYLGGIGTLRGYNHKEFSGQEFVMGNIEVRQAFPRSDMAASLFYDAGAITDSVSLRDVEVKQSIGLGLYLGDDFKLNLAKRLDRSGDNSPEFWVRFEHLF